MSAKNKKAPICAKCPVCDGGLNNLVQVGSALDCSSSEEVEVFRCSSCGHGFSRANAGFSQYLYGSGAYNQQESIWHILIKPVLSIIEIRKLRFLSDKNDQKADVFEVGCGKGRFLEKASACGFDVAGIEPSDRSYKYAKVRLGQKIDNLTLDEYVEKNGNSRRFKNIVLWHVLEHLVDPFDALLRANTILSDDGRVVIAVPNYSSFQALYGGNNWYHLDPTRHIHHFTPKSLNTLASKCGFQIKKTYYSSFYQNFLGEFVTLVNVLSPIKNIYFNAIKLGRKYFSNRNFGWWCVCLVLAVMTPFLMFIAFGLTVLNQCMHRSGTIVCILEKLPVGRNRKPCDLDGLKR
jgi:2-polyprenyl-3-methyl-5-hydroxy-6-metoxy-1,4-benzoquinol methylase